MDEFKFMVRPSPQTDSPKGSALLVTQSCVGQVVEFLYISLGKLVHGTFLLLLSVMKKLSLDSCHLDGCKSPLHGGHQQCVLTTHRKYTARPLHLQI